MSTLKTHNLQSPDAGSVNVALTPNAGMVVAGISTFNGNIDVDGHTDLDNVSISGVTTSSNKFEVNSLGIGIQPIDHHHIHIESANPRILIRSTGTNAAKILFGDNSSNDPGVIEYAHSENSMRFNTGNLERLRITGSGYLKHTGLRAGNSENKLAILVTPSYNTSEEDVLVYQAENESGSNQLTIGGGTGSYNATTILRFLTASAVNTTGGTERLRIDSSGSLLVANTTGSRTNLSGNADDIVIGNTSTSNETGITFFSTSATSLRFNDAAGTDGAIEYGHTARSLTFSSANANKMRITQVSGGSQPKVSIGALANSAYLNTSTNGDRSTVKIGNYLHLDSGGNGNFTAGMYYNCWPNGQAYFQSGTVAPNSGDNRAAAVVCRYGGTYIYGDNSTTAWSSGNTITSMQRNMQVTSAGYVLKPNNPSFHVGNPNVAGGSSGQVWRCNANAIYSNVGSHYDNSNGRFTAPITGTYFFFHWGMSSGSGQTCDIYSRKNGSRDQLGTSYNHPSGGQHDQFGCSYIRYLTTGDYVDVYTANGGVYNNSDGRHGGWGGWLIG